MQRYVVYAVTYEKKDGVAKITIHGYGMHGLLFPVSAAITESGYSPLGFSVSDIALSVRIPSEEGADIYRLLCRRFFEYQGQSDGSI